jgi:hypothetical protein
MTSSAQCAGSTFSAKVSSNPAVSVDKKLSNHKNHGTASVAAATVAIGGR